MTTDSRHKSITNTGTTPTTLTQAHDYLTRIRPKRSASETEWLAYYRHSAVLYAQIAEIDRGHHHEALYWAERERTKADQINTTGTGQTPYPT
ncbi:MAG: AMED_5909 family protein [Sciscionella sp.]